LNKIRLTGLSAKITNALSHLTTFPHDAMDRLMTITCLDSTTSTFTYDSLGRRTSNRAQQRHAPKASECDEMEMAASIVADKFVSHGKKEKSKPRLSKSGRVGHPEGQRPGKCRSQCLVDDVQKWYYSAVKNVN
jgi:YD repeat-containing protein